MNSMTRMTRKQYQLSSIEVQRGLAALLVLLFVEALHAIISLVVLIALNVKSTLQHAVVHSPRWSTLDSNTLGSAQGLKECLQNISVSGVHFNFHHGLAHPPRCAGHLPAQLRSSLGEQTKACSPIEREELAFQRVEHWVEEKLGARLHLITAFNQHIRRESLDEPSILHMVEALGKCQDISC